MVAAGSAELAKLKSGAIVSGGSCVADYAVRCPNKWIFDGTLCHAPKHSEAGDPWLA